MRDCVAGRGRSVSEVPGKGVRRYATGDARRECHGVPDNRGIGTECKVSDQGSRGHQNGFHDPPRRCATDIGDHECNVEPGWCAVRMQGRAAGRACPISEVPCEGVWRGASEHTRGKAHRVPDDGRVGAEREIRRRHPDDAKRIRVRIRERGLRPDVIGRDRVLDKSETRADRGLSHRLREVRKLGVGRVTQFDPFPSHASVTNTVPLPLRYGWVAEPSKPTHWETYRVRIPQVSCFVLWYRPSWACNTRSTRLAVRTSTRSCPTAQGLGPVPKQVMCIATMTHGIPLARAPSIAVMSQTRFDVP